MAATISKNLGQLLRDLRPDLDREQQKIVVTGISADSRAVGPGDLFIATAGQTVDSHDYISAAIDQGCAAVVVEAGRPVPEPLARKGPPLVEVADSRGAVARIAAAFYGHPAHGMRMIGITGTNGKTTVTYLAESIIRARGGRPGVIGTINYRYDDRAGKQMLVPAPLTTPEPVFLQKLLHQMAAAGVTHLIMETSSHGLAQGRLAGIFFDIAVFTNLSRDHLDFHRDMDDYFASKKRLFQEQLKPKGRAVIVQEKAATLPAEAWGRRLAAELPGRQLLTCGQDPDNLIHPLRFACDLSGIRAELATPRGRIKIHSALVGEFNLNNILAATGIGLALDIVPETIARGLDQARTIPGRLERIYPDHPLKRAPTVLVDFAHTPDALDNVLSALKQLKPERLFCVFGCGGDRDPGKRELMGETAGLLADVVIATSDNPRSEEPAAILDAVLAGIKRTGRARLQPDTLDLPGARGYMVIVSRRQAIRVAVSHAGPNDLVLVSGKGHETCQLRGKTRKFFSDRIEAEKQLACLYGPGPAWSLEQVTAATRGRVMGKENLHTDRFSGVSTDTRTLQPGNLFVGLNGPNFIGRDFADTAVQKGAAALLLDQPPAGPAAASSWSEVPVILVDDTLEALGNLAAAHRARLGNLKVLAITGSSGKTTVKEMTAAILARTLPTLKSEGNFNNLIGLPLTLLQATADHRIAVLEMGMNRPGELARLAEIAAPDLSCITNIQEAHLAGLGSINGVARAKGELFAGSKSSAILAVNLDDQRVRKLARPQKQKKITYAATPAGRRYKPLIRATRISNLGQAGTAFTLHISGKHRRVRLSSPGRHNVGNALAAAALAHGAGTSLPSIVAGLESYTPLAKRAEIVTLPNGIKIINDTYNANPASMNAALRTLRDIRQQGKTVAVLGEMLELGRYSDDAHRTLGTAAAELPCDFVAAIGEHAGILVKAARSKGMAADQARSFSDKQKLCAWLAGLITAGRLTSNDWILIKGSRGMRMETVIKELQQCGLTTRQRTLN
ncbi:MAG: UDP-N-acetylmuramoyl-L-alanyl-D-glutamate--2,6-diaminopimelate ligase [Desulfobacterales bacterium]|nr:UDP-N-acetylmuramoyl-L-alanyl-D-glutamate--2,6-diaminopimelate ligase [Desulfobacterales bacterium]